MRQIIKGSVTVNNKKHPFTIKEIKKDEVYFDCEGAGVGQGFLLEDIGGLFLALPDFILEEQAYRAKQKHILRFRVSQEEKKDIMKKALKKGYKTVSSFLRALALGS